MHAPGRARVNFSGHFFCWRGRFGGVEVVQLVVLDSLLRAITKKKVVNLSTFFEEKSALQDKILAML